MSHWNSYATVIAATVVEDLDQAEAYYNSLFGAIPLYQIDHIQDHVDLKSILKYSDMDMNKVDASVRFINLGSNNYVYEIAQFHHQPYVPSLGNSIIMKIYLHDVAAAFAKVKASAEATLLSEESKLSTIFSPCGKHAANIKFFVDDVTKEEILAQASNNLGGFIFVDKYQVIWEVLGEINVT